MKTCSFFISTVYIFLLVSGSVYGFEEKTFSLGGKSTWAAVEQKNGVAETVSVRANPVLVIASVVNSAMDLSVTFDEKEARLFADDTGNYKVSVPQDVKAMDRNFARAGNGAALFHKEALVAEPRGRNALFAPGNRIGDFTIEFWIHPLNLENGEQILSWVSTKQTGGNYAFQHISCIAVKNRLQWSFTNFFTSPHPSQTANAPYIDISFLGDSPVVPKTWSHHLVRFEASTGMVEYLVNGISEVIVYATPTGHESGNIYTPVTGDGGRFLIGESFTGLMDELKIHNTCVSRSSVQRYVPGGGRAETGAIDLGGNNSSVLRIDALGGRFSVKGTKINSEFQENGRFRFSDDSEMQFFFRCGDNPWLMNNSAWLSFVPGQEIKNSIRGRYLQLAVNFYPSADGETSPYLDELRVIYQSGEPPLPPGSLTAIAVDGGVMLRWKNSPDSHTEGYLVYYSAVRGEFFGEDATLGPSPIDAGKRNNLLIDGLKNGTLYYFRVAAYDRTSEFAYNTGEFSREASARPLTGLSLQAIGDR